MPLSSGRIIVSASDCRREGGDRALEVVGLAAQQDEIERLPEVFGEHRRRRTQRDVTFGALDDQTDTRQLGRAPGADQET